MRVILAGVLTLSLWMVAYTEGAEVRELITQLASQDSDARRAAAKQLGELGPEAKAAVPELARAMRDRDLFVRRFSAEALGNIGPEAKGGVSAVEALGKIGPDSIPALIAALKDPNKDPAIRKKAAQGLGKIGLRARGAVPVMSDILTGKIRSPKASKKNKKGDDDIRTDVAIALGSVAKPEDKNAIDALKTVSEGKQRNRQLKKAAAISLRKITGQAPAKKKMKK